MMHYMMGNEEPARIALQQAVKATAAYPGKEEAERRLAVLNLDTTKPASELVSFLEKSLKENPNDMISLTRLAGLHERSGNVDKAIQTYETALTKAIAAPANPAFSRARQAKAFVEMLGIVKDPGKLPSAQTRIREVLKVDPGFTPAMYASGMLSERSGKLKEAQAAYEAVLNRFPGFFPAMKQLAGVLASSAGNATGL